MKAIEMGIINEMTKARMDELTEQKQALSAARADAGLARGFKLTRNMILYFLRKMAAMDISDRDSQKRLIKTFVNAIYLYDDHFDIAFNYTENGKVIVKMQEIDDASTGGAFGCCAQCPGKQNLISLSILQCFLPIDFFNSLANALLCPFLCLAGLFKRLPARRCFLLSFIAAHREKAV